MLFQPQASDVELLTHLLDRLDGTPEREEEVGRWIDERFGHTNAIMIIDMCGFSRTAEEHGIIEFLRRMHQVQAIIVPVISRRAGMVINTLADSLAVLFPTVDAALGAATEMVFALDEHNEATEGADHYLSIGIGFGRILVFDGRDAFGPEMNRAGKLGEDEADAREILLTPAAVRVLPDDVPLNAKVFEIGGARVVAGVVDLDGWKQLDSPTLPGLNLTLRVDGSREAGAPTGGL